VVSQDEIRRLGPDGEPARSGLPDSLVRTVQ
jgi:hypothetical protein